MADYWKSQPRRFCEMCKCWFGDNRASIDFHERGKRHKENVEKHLREARQKSSDKEKKDAETTIMLASIEKAASTAYQLDLEQQHGGLKLTQRAKLLTAATNTPTPLYQDSTTATHMEMLQKIQQKQQQQQQQQQGQLGMDIRERSPPLDGCVPPPPPSVWQQVATAEGHVYYYNVLTRETQWEAPPEFAAKPGEAEEVNEGKEEEEQEGKELFVGKKRQAGEGEMESTEGEEPVKRRPHNAYGDWVTVAVRPQQPDSAEEEEEEGEEDEETSSSDEEGRGREEVDKETFKERTVVSLATEVVPGNFKGFGFKKKAVRPQTRQRTSEL